MGELEAIKLKINDKVIIKSDNENELDSMGKVVCVDNWRRKIGVVNFQDEYFEFPYRKIKSKA